MNINDKYKTIKEWALAYRKAGWNVMPLYNYSKSPALVKCFVDGEWKNTWLPLQERMATDEEFETWFNDDKVTGIGLICGPISGVLAVDEDSYKAGGMEFEFVSPLRSKTGRGGKHHFFKYVEPIKTSGFHEGVNIEIKSLGGFVLLPPSQVFITPGLTDKGSYQWEAFCRFDVLPTITEEKLTKYRGTKTPNERINLSDVVVASEGNRHNNLLKTAQALYNKTDLKDWAQIDDTVRAIGRGFTPPHDEHDISLIIRDAREFILTNPTKKQQKQIEEIQQEKREIMKPRSLVDIDIERQKEEELEKDAPKTGWPDLDDLIGGFVPGHLYTLTGNENVGKTTLACNFAHRLAEQGKRVLYIALEPGNRILDYLCSVYYQKPFKEVTREDKTAYAKKFEKNIVTFVNQDIQDVVTLANTVRQLYEQAEQDRFDLVIIDHIGYFVSEKKNWVQEQGNVVKQLAFLTKDYKTAVMMIAHLRKKAPGARKDAAPTNDDIAGSGAFKQDSTEVMIVIRTTDDADGLHYADKGKLWVTKTKMGPNGTIGLNFVDGQAHVMSEGEVVQGIRGIWSPEYQREHNENMQLQGLLSAPAEFDRTEEDDVKDDDLDWAN